MPRALAQRRNAFSIESRGFVVPREDLQSNRGAVADDLETNERRKHSPLEKWPSDVLARDVDGVQQMILHRADPNGEIANGLVRQRPIRELELDPGRPARKVLVFPE